MVSKKLCLPTLPGTPAFEPGMRRLVFGGKYQRYVKGGADSTFDAQNGGIGIGKISSKVPADIVAKVRGQETKLSAGQIPGIPDVVK